MSSNPLINQVINGRYRLLRELGQGTTGMVYSAWDHELEREVAVKIIHDKLIHNQEVVSRFDLEIRISARLQHPGLVAVFEQADLTSGRIGYIMTQAIGEDLRFFLDNLKDKRDPWRSVNLVDRLTLFSKILDVMAYAHEQGVVHRDLKPANIILGQHGEVWVIDWGLARVLREPEKPKDLEHAFDDMFGGQTEEYTAQSVKRAMTRPGGAAALTSSTRNQDVDEDATRVGGGQPQTGVDNVRDQSEDATVVSSECSAAHTGTGPGSAARNSRSQGRMPTVSTTRRNSRFASERSTQFGAVLGSPAYMSPEQARGDAASADERSDVYSLGVILFELLTMRTPIERRDNEALLAFIERVKAGDLRELKQLWADAPQSLVQMTARALSLATGGRFRTCKQFRADLKVVLDELSASFSEMERLRLEEERIGRWLGLGDWNYGSQPGLEPFTESVIAFEGEGIGQVMHPELGGVLLGGTGLQIYPIALHIADDLRLTMDLTINRGQDFTVFTRGAPPNGSYAFRIGGFGGRWLTIGRSQGQHDIHNPVLLTMRALEGATSTVLTDGHVGVRIKVVIEVVGSQLSVRLNDHDALIVNDPCPLIGPLHRQVAIGTTNSQVVIHSLLVEQRRSPLMVPAYAVANELLRQELYPQAIAYYKQFLTEHSGSREVVEANFMLCLAYLQAGHPVQAERELRDFLSEFIDNPLSQDAIFELARLTADLHGGSIERAVRTVLSYQESGDLVRSRFCLWVSGIIRERVRRDGLNRQVQKDLELLRHLISGFGDEALLLDTIAFDVHDALHQCTARLLDLDADGELTLQSDAIRSCREMGYPFSIEGFHRQSEYVALARRIRAVGNEDSNRGTEIGRVLKNHLTIRDLLCLAGLGCSEQLVEVLDGQEDLSPSRRIFRASVFLRLGLEERAQDDLQYCFRLMDVIETERTSQEVTSTARLAFYGLKFLPWNVVWEPIAQLSHGQEVQALAGWLAECLGDNEAAAEAYVRLSEIGSGFCKVAEQGMARIGMKNDEDA